MRSLWRMMAARWLGGHVSYGLSGDAVLLDLLMQADPLVTAGFQVRRIPQVSHRAMILQNETEPLRVTVFGEVFGTDCKG